MLTLLTTETFLSYGINFIGSGGLEKTLRAKLDIWPNTGDVIELIQSQARTRLELDQKFFSNVRNSIREIVELLEPVSIKFKSIKNIINSYI